MSKSRAVFFEFIASRGIDAYVESGRCHGDGITAALEAKFAKIYSVNCSQACLEHAQNTFSDAIASGKLHLIADQGAAALKTITHELESGALFCLGQHAPGAAASVRALNDEIAAIVARRRQDDFVLIEGASHLDSVGVGAGMAYGREVDRLIGQIAFDFPDHIGLRLDGRNKQDVFCLMPLSSAAEFFKRFPDAKELPNVATTAPEIISAGAKPSLVISAGGNNSRIGNHLPVYGRLLRFTQETGRTLHFPFFEKAAEVVFKVRHSGVPSDVWEEKAAQRLVRTAEEMVEAEQGVEPFQYSPDQLHEARFSKLGVKVLFGRGQIDWAAEIAAGRFDCAETIVLRDPFPFPYDDMNLDASISAAAASFEIRDDVLREAVAAIGIPPPPETTRPAGLRRICFHWRQGDFRSWAGGVHFYEPDLVAQIFDRIRRLCADRGVAVELSVASDEDVPDIVAQDDVRVVRAGFAPTFIGIALADIVFSNSSTFSQVAAAVGRQILKKPTHYRSLGKAVDALAATDIQLKRVLDLCEQDLAVS